jgi:hypothetical protein
MRKVDGQSASSSWCRTPCGTHDQISIFFCLTITFFLLHVRLPFRQENGSVICSAIAHWLESLRTRNHILLSHDLSSDHSLVLIILTSHALNHEKQPRFSNRHTNCDDCRHLINQRLTLNVSLKTEENIEAAVTFFNDTVQCAGWNATPENTDKLKTYDCPILIKQKIEEKRRLRRGWHRLRTPESKRLLNTGTQTTPQ